jgi:hypothetical protein
MTVNINDEARALLDRTRRASGVPEHLEDPATVEFVAGILRQAKVEEHREEGTGTVATGEPSRTAAQEHEYDALTDEERARYDAAVLSGASHDAAMDAALD